MALTKETILITTKMVDNISGATKDITQNIQQMSKGTQLATTQIKGMTAKGRELNQTIIKTTKGVKRFHFEWLGVMFAGMALYRVFGGLIRQQMELWGIMELFSSVMTVVFIPLMDLLLPIFLKLADAMMNMSPGAKLIMGLFVLIAAAIGGVLLVVGQFMLGLQSIGMVAAKVLPWIIANIGTLSAWFAGLIAVVYGVYLVIKGKFEGIGMIIMGIGIILLLFIGWWALIPVAVGAAVYLIIKYWDSIKNWFVKFWNTLKHGFSKLWDWIVDTAKWAWEKIKNLWANSPLGKMFNMALSLGGGLLGSFQTGGVVPATGPYMLHKGETVVPTGQGLGAMGPTNITVNANVSSDYDVRRLADQLSKYWAEDYRRLAKARGTM